MRAYEGGVSRPFLFHMSKIFLLLCLLLFTGAAHSDLLPAQSDAPVGSNPVLPFARVNSLMEQRQWQAAQAALQDAAKDPAADPIEVLFLGGLIALESQNYAVAIAQFQKILVDHPIIPRVRLELARAYFLSGDDEGAQYHFERALAGNLPEPVIANVRLFLEQIRARRRWQLGFGFGIMPDSNVNQGASAQTVTIGGLPFTLSSDARETSGVGLLWQLSGERLWNMAERWRFTASGNLLRKDYGKHQFNDMTLYARIGPRYLFGDGDVGFGLSLGKRLLGDRSYSDAQGLYTDVNHQIGERWLAYASVESQRYRFAEGKGEPGMLTFASGKLRYLLSPVSLVEGGMDISQDDTISDEMHHQTVGVSAGYRSEAAFGLLYGVSVRTAQSRYPTLQSFFNQHRNDDMTSLSMDVTKRDWQISGFSPVVSLTLIHNNSTIPLYSYRRTLGQIGFNRQF